MNKILVALLGILFFSSLAMAGSLTIISYDQTISSGYYSSLGLQGLILNGTFNVSGVQTFLDVFGNATVDTPPWFTNKTGTVTFQEVTSGGINLMNATSGTAATDIGNFTLLFNFNKPYDLNATFFLKATPTLAELRVSDGFWGNYTQTQILKPAGNDLPAAVPVSVYYNATNRSMSYYQSGVFSNTISIVGYQRIFLMFIARGNGAVSSTIQINHYMNITNATSIRDFVETDLANAPSFIYWNNATLSGNGNITSPKVFSQFPNGSTNFSIHFKNFWFNQTTSAGTLEGNYYFFWKNTSTINNASLFFRVLDESTGLAINFSVAFSNSTNNTISQNYSKTFWSNYTGIPNGFITISLSNYSYANYYYPRSRQVYFNDYPQSNSPSYQNLTLYLLPQGVLTGSVLIHVVNVQGSNIQGATVQIYRSLNGMPTLVDQGTTASDGSIGFFVEKFFTLYTLVVSAPGYDTSTSTTTFGSDTFTVVLGGGNPGNYSGFYYNTSVTILPGDPFLNVNSTAFLDFNASVNNTNCELTSFTFSVSNSTNNIFNQSNTNACGGFINYTLNTSPYIQVGTIGERFNVTVVISVPGFPNQTITQFITLQFTIPTGFEDGLRRVARVSTPWVNTLLGLLGAVLLTLFFSKYIGWGSGIITLIALGVFTYYGWIDSGIFTIAALTFIALIVGGRYLLS